MNQPTQPEVILLECGVEITHSVIKTNQSTFSVAGVAGVEIGKPSTNWTFEAASIGVGILAYLVINELTGSILYAIGAAVVPGFVLGISQHERKTVRIACGGKTVDLVTTPDQASAKRIADAITKAITELRPSQ